MIWGPYLVFTDMYSWIDTENNKHLSKCIFTADEMERAEQDRKKEAANLKSRMEEEAKQTQSGIGKNLLEKKKTFR